MYIYVIYMYMYIETHRYLGHVLQETYRYLGHVLQETDRYLVCAGAVPGLGIETAPFVHESRHGGMEEVDETESSHVDAAVTVTLQL